MGLQYFSQLISIISQIILLCKICAKGLPEIFFYYLHQIVLTLLQHRKKPPSLKPEINSFLIFTKNSVYFQCRKRIFNILINTGNERSFKEPKIQFAFLTHFISYLIHSCHQSRMISTF